VGYPEMSYLKNEPYSITIPIQIRTKVKAHIKPGGIVSTISIEGGMVTYLFRYTPILLDI
jgi:hypothetical protein